MPCARKLHAPCRRLLPRSSSARWRRRRRGPGAVSEPRHQTDRSLRGRRRAGHRRALRRPAAAGAHRPVGRRREPAGRKRQRRGGGDRGRAGRWLHPDGDRQRDAVRQSAVLQAALLQPAEFRAGRAAGARAAVSRRASGRAGRNAARVHRLREGAARPGQLRLVRRRQHASSDDGGHEVGAAAHHDPRPVPRGRPIGAGTAGRSRPGAVLGLPVPQGRRRNQPRAGSSRPTAPSARRWRPTSLPWPT